METPLFTSYLWNDTFVSTEEVESLRPLRDEAVYEVIRLQQGKPLFFEAHYVRFCHSAQAMGTPLPFSAQDVLHKMRLLMRRNQMEEGNIKLLWTTDSLAKRHFILYASPARNVTEEERNTGVSTATVQFEREKPGVKVQRDAYRTKTDALIQEKQVFEILLYDEEGCIREGSRSNVFFVKDDRVYTAPTYAVLDGITRIQVTKAMQERGIQCIEEAVSVNDIEAMDACFLTGTSIDVLPIKSIDGHYFESASNPIVETLQKAYQEKIKEDQQQFRW